MVNSVRVCKVDVMTDQDIEQAKLEAREQGRREQRLEDLENDLKTHQDECSNKAQRLWEAVDKNTKMTYIGFGVLLALQAFGTWTDFFK